MNKLIRRMVENRGYPADFLLSINTCGHDLPAGVLDMCSRLDYYRQTNGRVVLLSDFDADGIMSGVLGFAGLAEMGFNVALYLPQTDEYGFGPEDVDKIRIDYPDVQAILTADVGISAYQGVSYARDLGIEVLVTDHHLTKTPSDSNVFVDPMLDENPNVFGSICGAHVLYLVLRYYAEHFHPAAKQMIPQIERLRVFAGIATVADSMPVYHENRPLIRDAVSICRLLYADGLQDVVNMIPGCDIYRRCMLGLFVMIRVFAAHGKVRDSASIDETFFGFYVAPAINSIKRMGGDVLDIYNVFFGGAVVAEASMEKILDLTSERKSVVEQSLSRILDDLDAQPWSPFIFVTDAISGVRGLLAQRLTSMTGMPVLVVGQTDTGTYAGSGRSPSWFPFIDIVGTMDAVHPAGHNAAFGISFDSASACEDFVVFLKKEIKQRKPADLERLARPDFQISTVHEADTGIDLDLFEDYLETIGTYRPFGVGFPEPVAELEFRPADALWMYLGRDHKHVKAVLPGGLVLICFNQADLFPDEIRVEAMPAVTKVRGKLSLNEYNGIQTVQFIGQMDSDMDQSGRDLTDASVPEELIFVMDGGTK